MCKCLQLCQDVMRKTAALVTGDCKADERRSVPSQTIVDDISEEEEDVLWVLSWNVNGLAPLAPTRRAEELGELFESLGADIICLQETKLTKLEHWCTNVPGWFSFHSVCRVKSGYAGVATYVRPHVMPLAAEVKRESDDDDGRIVMTDHGGFSLFNVYAPAKQDNEERFEQRTRFYKRLSERIAAERARGRHVLLAGDLNARYDDRDTADWDSVNDPSIKRSKDGEDEENKPRIGRTWLSGLLVQNGGAFCDPFRVLHGWERCDAFTCWNTRRNARASNYGTRLDYILSTVHDREAFVSADLHTEQMGSDHCPVSLKVNASAFPGIRASKEPPRSCANIRSDQSLYAMWETATTTTTTADREPNPKRSTTKRRRRRPPPQVPTLKTGGTSKQSAPKKQRQTYVMGKPPPQVLCSGHKEPAVLRTTSKKGVNSGRKFFGCARGIGEDCKFFLWESDARTLRQKK